MITISKNKLFLKIYTMLAWVIIFVSVNTMPGELNYMNESLTKFINGSRTILAFGFSFVSIIIIFLIYITKKPKKLSVLLILFILYFIFQVFGLIGNDLRPFDIHRTYLVVYALGIISILIIIDYYKLYDLFPYIFIISLSIISVAYLIIIINASDQILSSILQGNMYAFLHPDIAFYYQAPPRITGITRSFGIISLALIAALIYRNKFNLSSAAIFLVIIILSTSIWLGQSRGSILCYYVTSILMIILLKNIKVFKKILLIISITMISVLIGTIIINFAKYSINDSKIEKENLKKFEEGELLQNNVEDQSLENKKEEKDNSIINNNIIEMKGIPRVIQLEEGTSGRLDLWLKALNKFEKNKIFGYGPQADRFLLSDKRNKYANNVSNTILYGFLCGGYFSLITLILVYLYAVYLIFLLLIDKISKKNIRKLNSENFFVFLAIAFTFFFMLRSIFENSFGLFSIDFLIFILSLFILEKQFSEKSILNLKFISNKW